MTNKKGSSDKKNEKFEPFQWYSNCSQVILFNLVRTGEISWFERNIVHINVALRGFLKLHSRCHSYLIQNHFVTQKSWDDHEAVMLE